MAQAHGAGHAEQRRAGIGAEAAAGPTGRYQCRCQGVDQRGLAHPRRTDQQHAPVAGQHGLHQRRRIGGQRGREVVIRCCVIHTLSMA